MALSSMKKKSEDKVIGTRKGLGVFKTEKERTSNGGILEPYKYKRTSIDTAGYAKGKPTYEVKTQTGQGDKSMTPSVKSNEMKKIARKDVPGFLKSLK